MPMYYPDLKSVKVTCEDMAKYQKKEKLYKGIIPQTEEELPRARIELGQYFRDVWNDQIAAIEVEQAADKNNYDAAISRGMFIPNLDVEMDHEKLLEMSSTREELVKQVYEDVPILKFLRKHAKRRSNNK